MAFQEFPKWLYHPKEAAKTVKNREEQDALGSEWVEHPDKLPPKEAEAQKGEAPAAAVAVAAAESPAKKGK